MRKGLFTLLSLVCAGLIWAAPAPANAADKIVIRFAHSNTPSDMDPYHALVTKMNDKLVKKLGADRIEIQEFPAGQIGRSTPPASSAARNAPFRTCSRASSR